MVSYNNWLDTSVLVYIIFFSCEIENFNLDRKRNCFQVPSTMPRRDRACYLGLYVLAVFSVRPAGRPSSASLPWPSLLPEQKRKRNIKYPCLILYYRTSSLEIQFSSSLSVCLSVCVWQYTSVQYSPFYSFL